MRKILAISIFLLSMQCFAVQTFTCPTEVICSIPGDKKSCSWVGKGRDNWNPAFIEGGKIMAGTYIFEKAWGNFENPNPDSSWCHYMNNDAGFPKDILILGSAHVKMEALHDKSNSWKIGGYIAMCLDSNPMNCPYTLV
jgi:hypothetical protein